MHDESATQTEAWPAISSVFSVNAKQHLYRPSSPARFSETKCRPRYSAEPYEMKRPMPGLFHAAPPARLAIAAFMAFRLSRGRQARGIDFAVGFLQITLTG